MDEFSGIHLTVGTNCSDCGNVIMFGYPHQCQKQKVEEIPVLRGGAIANEMKAGRELDALIAERVMGCTVKYIESTPFCGCGQTCDYPHGEPDREGQLYGYLQHYSTDIAAAWEALEQMIERGYCPALLFDDVSHWHLSFEGTSPIGEKPSDLVVFKTGEWADTAPLAICRAALRAVGA